MTTLQVPDADKLTLSGNNLQDFIVKFRIHVAGTYSQEFVDMVASKSVPNFPGLPAVTTKATAATVAAAQEAASALASLAAPANARPAQPAAGANLPEKLVQASYRYYRENIGKLCSDLVKRLSDESRNQMAAEPGFEEALLTNDFLMLWQIMEQTHKLTASAAVAQRYVHINKLNALRQGTLSLSEYAKSFNDMVRFAKDIQAHLPSEDALAHQFVMGLNMAVYRSELERVISDPNVDISTVIKAQAHFRNYEERKRAFGLDTPTQAMVFKPRTAPNRDRKKGRKQRKHDQSRGSDSSKPNSGIKQEHKSEKHCEFCNEIHTTPRSVAR